MNILLLSPDFMPNPFCGIGVHVYNLAQEYALAGHKVSVVIVKGHEYLTSQVKKRIQEGVTVYDFVVDNQICIQMEKAHINSKTYRVIYNSATIIPVIMDILNNNKFDIIHTHDLYPGILYDSFLHKTNIPHIATIHAMTSKENTVIDALRRYVYENSDGTIFVSKQLEQDCLARYGEKNICANKRKVIYNGISVNTTGINQKPEQIFTFCARLHYSKGCDILLKAFKMFLEMKDNYRDFKLYIMGEGEEKENLQKIIKEYNLQKSVIMFGYVDNYKARQIMHKSYVHILPSLFEGFPLSLLEALAEGTCVVASNVGGVKEIINNEINGIMIAPKDANCLANKLSVLVENRDTRDYYAYNGYLTAERYSWKAISEKNLAYYKEIIHTYPNNR